MSRILLFSIAALVSRDYSTFCATASSSPADLAEAAGGVRFASPLQTLTIWDKESDGPRYQFLQKYKAGLKAETEARAEVAAKRKEYFPAPTGGSGGGDWAEQAAQVELAVKKREDRLVEEAFDKAAASASIVSASGPSEKENNEYQFVGVVGGDGEKPITWYARKKAAGAKWSMRLVHVNRDAIIKDLYNRGKVDVFARYANTGKTDEATGQPVVESKYEVRERSWRNLWNFSPKHFFTDSSGMYWRERRLRPGLYTDGTGVYETSYRYSDGRNGMRQTARLDAFLNSKAVDQATKDSIRAKLSKNDPDIVLED